MYVKDKTFERVSFGKEKVTGEFENCRFLHCDFSESDLSACIFTSCGFLACNMSLAKLRDASFQEVEFRECKMLGWRFDTCNPFGLVFSFHTCVLDHASFFNTKIQHTVFYQTQLKEVDFSQSDLTGVSFEGCNLLMAYFERTILEKTDFRNAQNFEIDPETNRIRKAKFSLSGLPGLLKKHQLHIEP